MALCFYMSSFRRTSEFIPNDPADDLNRPKRGGSLQNFTPLPCDSIHSIHSFQHLLLNSIRPPWLPSCPLSRPSRPGTAKSPFLSTRPKAQGEDLQSISCTNSSHLPTLIHLFYSRPCFFVLQWRARRIRLGSERPRRSAICRWSNRSWCNSSTLRASVLAV